MVRIKVLAPVFIAILLTFFAVSSSATTYYVSSSSGNDSNNGASPSTPWAHAPGQTGATENPASTTLQPNDFVYFKRGETWASQGITFNASGTSGHPITFGAYGSGNLPKFNGNGGAYGMGFFYILNRSWITIENLELTNAAESILTLYYTSSKVTGITIQNCTIHDNVTPGYTTIFFNANNTLGGITNVTFTGNTVYNSKWNGIRIIRGVTNSTISNNTFYNCEHHAIDTWRDAGDKVNDNITITGNHAYNCYAGIYAPNLSNSTISKNLFRDMVGGNGSGGIRLPSLNGYSPTGNKVINNIIYDVDSVDSNAVLFENSVDTIFANNTIFSNYKNGLSSGNTNFKNINNLFYASTHASSFSDYGSDPQFVNAVSRPPDLHLQAGSPCIDQGVDIGLPYLGEAPDLGAYEYNPDNSGPNPPTGLMVLSP